MLGFSPTVWRQDTENVRAKVIMCCSFGKDAGGLRAANKENLKGFLQLWESGK